MAFAVSYHFFSRGKPQTRFSPHSESGKQPPDGLCEMARNILTIESKKRLESRKRLTPFRKWSRVMNQFVRKHQGTFCQWVTTQQKRGLLMLKEGETPSDITYLHFKFRPHARHGRGEFCKYDVYMGLANLIRQVGGTEGMEHNLMVFYRYIASPEHSNLHVHYKALKRQLQGMIDDD